MPFTPYHFGPGLLIKAIFPKHFSFLVFIFVQVIIDFETLYHMLMHHHPLHQFLHTYLGSSLVVLAALLIFRPVYNFFFEEMSFNTTAISAMVGAYSHVFLDSIVHLDMKPLTPYSNLNSMLHYFEAEHLQMLCIYSAAAGLAILLLRGMFSKKRS